MKRKALIIVGPTAIGKTELSLLIAKLLPVEIVSADSRQIYRYLNIGTAKPKPSQMRRIPHHMIDILNPDEYYSAGMYCRQTRQIIDQIFKRKKIPLVVGGSGLYIKALLDGFFNLEIRDDKIRSSLRHRLSTEGLDVLYAELQKVDPILAARLSPTDKQRIIRGLEVYLITGTPLSQLQEEKSDPANFIPVMFGLRAPRDYLYERINRRVDLMLEEGFITEVANLRNKGYKVSFNALNTVGYKEAFAYLENEIDFDTMVELIKRNTRRYAKRQMTWFRKDERIEWIDITPQTDYRQLAEQIVARFKERS